MSIWKIIRLPLQNLTDNLHFETTPLWSSWCGSWLDFPECTNKNSEEENVDFGKTFFLPFLFDSQLHFSESFIVVRYCIYSPTSSMTSYMFWRLLVYTPFFFCVWEQRQKLWKTNRPWAIDFDSLTCLFMYTINYCVLSAICSESVFSYFFIYSVRNSKSLMTEIVQSKLLKFMKLMMIYKLCLFFRLHNHRHGQRRLLKPSAF